MPGEPLRYDAAVAPFLLPHLRDRSGDEARPDGAGSPFLFVKRAGSSPLVRTP
jgi:DNA primase